MVILLGGLEFDELHRTRIFHIIKNGVDWYQFLSECIKTNMVCLVYKSMLNLGIERLLPVTVKRNMKYHYEQNSFRNQYLLSSLGKLIQELAKQEVSVIPVKGAKLLTTIYCKDPGVRLLNDIDLLAAASDRAAIHTYMKENGFFSYLINNQDALCAAETEEVSHFYISFLESGLQDDIRIDVDYTYPPKVLENLDKESDPVYEFYFLCQAYYTSMKGTGLPLAVDQFNYVKLVDIFEFYKRFLSHMTSAELKSAAEAENCIDQVSYALQCLAQLHENPLII